MNAGNRPILYLLLTALSAGSTTGTQAMEPRSSPALEEVVVTAQKRSQSLQDVPASLNAFSASDIEDAGWQDINRLQEAVPALVINGESKTRTFISIRGIGTRKFDIGAEGSVGLFIDEVYVARFSSALTGIMDLERIEILKGPQGTLYGRNTIGGAINMITRAPTAEFEARIKAKAANYDAYEVSGNISGALTDELTARLSASSNQTNGVYKDTVSGNKSKDEYDALRLSLLHIPSDSWEIGFSADYSDISSDAVLTDIVPGVTTPIVLVPPNDPRVAPIIAETEQDQYENAYTMPGFVDREFGQYSLKLKHHANWGEVLSLSSFSKEDYSEARDFDGTSLDAWNHLVEQESKQFSQEFRLSSSEGGLATFGDKLQWVAGVYYYRDDAERDDLHTSGNGTVLNPIALGLDEGFTLFDIEVDTKSYAVYSQATYAISNDLSLTAGLRYTKDDKEYVYIGDTNAPTPPVSEYFIVEDDVEFDSTDPKLALDYHINDSAMVYISYAEGYKSGGVQFGAGTAETAVNSFDEERLRSIEIGLKSRLLDDRIQLNAAAYDYDFEDQQMQQIVSVNGAPVGVTENAATSEMNGIEVEALALLTAGLTLDVKYAWQDAKFDDFISEEGDFSGNYMPAAPEHAYTVSLRQDTSIGRFGDLSVSATYAWKDEQYFNFRNTDLAQQGDYGVVNVAAIWILANQQTRIRLYCDNCDDEEYLLNFTAFPAIFGGGRNTWDYGRRYGIELSHDF
jgi:iron complex outermembrane recepter protein